MSSNQKRVFYVNTLSHAAYEAVMRARRGGGKSPTPSPQPPAQSTEPLPAEPG